MNKNNKKLLDKITPLEQDFARWYQDVVVKGNMIEYGRTQGSMMFKPISYGIWENIQTEMNKIFRKLGVQNVYLPLLIPMSYIEKEKDHVAGFAPELATITKVGDKDLDEHLVIRPTSEVLFGELFSKEINSYNDLPIVYNQWANVLRWEKKTNPFLRNREFLWQEGHTSHATVEEAQELAMKMIKVYSDFAKDFLAMPVLVGQKTDHEKFAGGDTTYTIEAMMKDGKALQAGTSHYLGENFAKAFGVEFKNKENKKEYAKQTSWGVSTRLIGGLIMTHGDNRGVIIPPRIAPNQVDVISIFAKKNPEVKEKTTEIFESLVDANVRARIDQSDKGPGFKAGKSEIEGTPLRIEVGPRDLANGLVTFVRRDNNEKIQVEVENINSKVAEILDDIQSNLYNQAKARLDENLVEASSLEEMQELVDQKKFVMVPFAGGAEEEDDIKAKTGMTTRCIPLDMIGQTERVGKCISTGVETTRFVVFAKAY